MFQKSNKNSSCLLTCYSKYFDSICVVFGFIEKSKTGSFDLEKLLNAWSLFEIQVQNKSVISLGSFVSLARKTAIS